MDHGLTNHLESRLTKYFDMALGEYRDQTSGHDSRIEGPAIAFRLEMQISWASFSSCLYALRNKEPHLKQEAFSNLDISMIIRGENCVTSEPALLAHRNDPSSPNHEGCRRTQSASAFELLSWSREHPLPPYLGTRDQDIFAP